MKPTLTDISSIFVDGRSGESIKLDAAYLDAVLFPLSWNKGFQRTFPLVEWHSAPLSSFFSVVLVKLNGYL